MVERKRKYLKELKSERGLTYYGFKKNYQSKLLNFEVIIKEISSPVIIISGKKALNKKKPN